jgi:hypothetical protein
VRANITSSQLREGIAGVRQHTATLDLIALIQAGRRSCGVPEGAPNEQLDSP